MSMFFPDSLEKSVNALVAEARAVLAAAAPAAKDLPGLVTEARAIVKDARVGVGRINAIAATLEAELTAARALRERLQAAVPDPKRG